MLSAYPLDYSSNFSAASYPSSTNLLSNLSFDSVLPSLPFSSQSSLRVRKPRRHLPAPYHLPAPPLLSAEPSSLGSALYNAQHTPVVIPSNVYAPQTLPLHSPQPLSGYSPLSSLADTSLAAGFCPPKSEDATSQPEIEMCSLPTCEISEYPPSNTFPTPSELLSDLTQRDLAAPKESGKKTKKRKSQPDISNVPEGYKPTDPDTISSHDKKRYYLDCIEQYVLYLHEQLRLAGVEPMPFERVSSGRGLNSRSIRTMLVHMQKSASTLSRQRLDLEEKIRQSNAPRRHSIAHAGLEPSYTFP